MWCEGVIWGDFGSFEVSSDQGDGGRHAKVDNASDEGFGEDRCGNVEGSFGGVSMIEVDEIQSWLFQIEPRSGQSLSHFLGRFRRSNDLTPGGLASASAAGDPQRIESGGAGADRNLDEDCRIIIKSHTGTLGK